VQILKLKGPDREGKELVHLFLDLEGQIVDRVRNIQTPLDEDRS
jgi:hypothetical protein